MFGEPVLPLPGVEISAMTFAWSADGELVAGSGTRPGPQVWRSDSGERISLTAHGEFCAPAIWGPRGDTLLAGTSAGRVLELDYRTERVVRSVRVFDHDVRDMALSPDGGLLAVGSQEGGLWLGRTSDLSTVVSVAAHGGAVRSVSWHPSGRSFASGGHDNVVRVWGADGAMLSGLADHAALVTRVCYSPDGTLLASASNDSTIRLWHLAEQRYVRVLDRFEGWWVWDFAFAFDGRAIVSLDQDPRIAVWRLTDGALLWQERASFGTTSVAIHPREPIVWCGGTMPAAKGWRLRGSIDDDALGAPEAVRPVHEPSATRSPEDMSPDERFQLGMGLVLINAELAQTHLEAAAEAGHSDAMHLAGSVAEDLGQPDRAESWYARAAERGQPQACFATGRLAMIHGDLASAERWFAQAPDETYGDASGYGLLAELAHDRGDTVAEQEWVAKGVAAGDAASLVHYGVNGIKLGHAPSSVLPYFRRAADQGHGHGMFLMGVTTARTGEREQAAGWLKRAVGAGHPDAQEALDRLEGRQRHGGGRGVMTSSSEIGPHESDGEGEDPSTAFTAAFAAALRRAARSGVAAFVVTMIGGLAASGVLAIVCFVIAKSGHVALAVLVALLVFVAGAVTTVSGSVHRASAAGAVAAVQETRLCRILMKGAVKAMPENLLARISQPSAVADIRQWLRSRFDHQVSQRFAGAGFRGLDRPEGHESVGRDNRCADRAAGPPGGVAG